MTDDPLDRLERFGRREVPSIDPQFAERLESHLRAEHAGAGGARRRLLRPLPRFALAVAVIVGGIVGIVALTGRDARVGVGVEVGGDGSSVIAPAAPAGDTGAGEGDTTDAVSHGESPGEGVLAADPTPTATAQRPTPTESPTRAPTPTRAPASAPVPTASPTPTLPAPDRAGPTAAPSVAPPATPTDAARPDPTPTPVISDVRPTPTPRSSDVRPTPQPRPDPTPRPAITPTPRPDPTAVPAPRSIDLACAARIAGDAIGVVCDWTPVDSLDVTMYRVFRSRNGGETTVVSSKRADAPPTYVDRQVQPGDRVAYVVRAFAGDRMVGASARAVVDVASS